MNNYVDFVPNRSNKAVIGNRILIRLEKVYILLLQERELIVHRDI